MPWRQYEQVSDEKGGEGEDDTTRHWFGRVRFFLILDQAR